MDMMQLRKMVMAQMASGINIIKGSFTVPDSESYYTINFGKTLTKYIYFIEMNDDSKGTLLTTGYNANKAIAWIGIYPAVSVQNIEFNVKSYHSYRVNPSTSATVTASATVNNLDGSGITIIADNVNGSSANALYRGYKYNYTIIPLE